MDPRPPSTAAIWTSPERTESLRQHADRHAVASREESDLLLEATDLKPGLLVLDLACGSGDPTLEIAPRVAPGGRVTGADLSEGALDVGRERARKANLANVEFQPADADSLPFPGASFDRVVCRFGVMFFEDLGKALDEIHRVLRPGGRLALMVWGPFDQPYFQSTVGVIMRHIRMTELPPEKTVPFRFATPGALEDALTSAGFGEVQSRTHIVNWVWDGSPEEVRDVWKSGAVFFRPLLDGLPDKDRSPAWGEIAESLRRFYDGRSVRIPETVRLVVAKR